MTPGETTSQEADDPQDHPWDPEWVRHARSAELPEEVDVVVVGAGAAGCVLAGRLSADPGRRVLLLEAGAGLPTGRSATPGTAFYALGEGADVLYPNETTPQAGLGGRAGAVPTGKGLGGSSAVNLFAWFQGDPADYDGWAAGGATGWGWEHVRPVFRRMEHYAGGPDEHHGAGGPVAVDTARDFEPVHTKFVAAGEQVGLAVTRDLNGACRTGVGPVHATIRDGVRHSAVDGYLRPAASRANLEARLGARVERVLVEDDRAVGVQVRGGRTVRAGQVVLAAGALRTPQLLMLSGIGAAAHLREHGIDVVVDSPGVGQNLQDHPLVVPVWSITSGRTLLDAADEDALRAYRLLRRGPQAVMPTVGAMLAPGDLDAEDGSETPGAASVQALVYLIGLDANMAPMDQPALSATTALLTPRSRGSVTLASAEPGAAPVIDPGYLSDAGDLPRLRAGVQRVREIMGASALDGVRGDEVLPGKAVQGQALDEWIRSAVTTQWHPAGTCRMGVDERAVVDPELRVHGIANLMVADASVMPTLTRGNIQAPTMMIAERAADVLRAST